MNHKVPKEHQGLEDNFRIIRFLCSKLFFISLITLLAACSHATVQSPVISPSPIPATSTSEPSPTPTTSPTSTPTATETPLPTATFTSTPTPTLALPVGLQTQLPPAAQAITAQNASQLREIANFGSPLLRKFTFTPDGKRGLVLTSTGVGIFDLQSGQLLGIHPPVNCYQPGYECNSFESYSITLNGERLALKLFNHVQVWDLTAGKILDILLKIQNNQYNFYHFISISPDGQVLSFEDLEPAATKYWETRTYHYNITTGEEIQDLPDQGHFRGLLSPDGRWSAESGGNGAIAVWQVKDWSLIGQTNLDQGTQEAIAFSPGGDLLAVQDDQSLYIYQVSPWRLIRQFSARSYNRWFINLANSVSFSPSGELLAILEGYQYNRGQPYTLYIGVWSISTGEPLSSQEFQDGIWGFSLSDEGEISQVQIPAQACLELGFPQASDCTQAPSYGRQIDVFPVGESLAIFQRDGEHYQVCRVKPGEAAGCAQPGEMSFLNLDGELYTIRRSSLSGSYEVYQEIAQSLSFLGSFQPANEDFSVHWLSVDKRLLLLTTGYADYTNSYIDQIELWDIQRKVLLRSWSGSYIPPEVSPDGNYLAVAANNKFILYDLRSNETIYSITDGRNLSTTPAFLNEYGGFAYTPDGRLVYPLISYQTNDQNLYNYDLIALELATRQTRSLVQLQLPLNELRAIAVSPDGSLLALGWPDGSGQIFDLQTGQELNHFQAHSANVTRLVFTPDGRYLASVAAGGGNGGDGFLRLWGIWL